MEDKGYVLRYACKMSDYEIVKLLIDKHNEKNEDGCKEILEVAINTENDYHYTALHYACKKKCPRTVKLLLDNGAGQQIYL